MEISNKTRRPLRIPLPGGKTLHLGPGKTGRVAPGATEHPPLRALIDEGKVAVVSTAHDRGSASPGGKAGIQPSRGGGEGGGVRHIGDR